jgi:hypothetical protein
MARKAMRAFMEHLFDLGHALCKGILRACVLNAVLGGGYAPGEVREAVRAIRQTVHRRAQAAAPLKSSPGMVVPGLGVS